MLYAVQIDDQQSIVGQSGHDWIVVGHICVVAPSLEVAPGRIHPRDPNDLVQCGSLADIDDTHPIGETHQGIFRTIWGGIPPHIIGAGTRIRELCQLLYIQTVLCPEAKRAKRSQ